MMQLKWSPGLILALLVLWALCAGASEPESQPDPTASLEALLAGEFAGQEGDHGEAARAYLDAALISDDPAVAERAAKVALLSEDSSLARRALSRWAELAPDSLEMATTAAVLALRDRRVEDAERIVRGLIERPEDGWRAALRALMSSGDAEASGAVLQRILEARALPDDLSAWLAFGGLAQRFGLAEPVEHWAAALVERFPDEPRVRLLQAGVFRQQGDKAAAMAAVAAALEAGDDDESLRIAAAAELEQLEEPQAAAAALARGPQSRTTWAARAGVLNGAGDREGLAALYQEVTAAAGESPEPEVRLLLGQLAEALERNEEALEWYGGLSDGSVRPLATMRTAVILAEVSRLDEALSSLRALQQEDFENPEPLRNAFLLEGELLLREGRTGQAVDAYSRGLERLPDDSELLYARALGHERGDDIPAAEADFRRLLEADPDNANVLNALGYTLADRTDRYDEALALIERALEQLPDTAAVIDSMGWVLYRLDRLEESLAYLRRAFELQADAEIAAHLGEVLWFSGRRDEARDVWREGLEADPEHLVLLATLRRLAPELLP